MDTSRLAGSWEPGTGEGPPPGHRASLRSLVLVALNVPWLLVLWLIGMVVGRWTGQPPWTLLIALMLVPSLAGIAYGVVAARQGARQLAAPGLVANGVVAVLIVAFGVAMAAGAS